jgi:hypothetical protein
VIKEFGSDSVTRIEGVNAHVDREWNLSSDCTRIEKPILDFDFLQNCELKILPTENFY